jgi:hypothetical protein
MSFDKDISRTGVRFPSCPPKVSVMNKLFYILVSVLMIACEEERSKPNLKTMQSLGMVNNWHELNVYHDDLRDNTCYVVTSRYESNPVVLSCVKDNHPSY